MRSIGSLCFLLFSVNAFAATVTVSMAQNSDAPPVALEMTRAIENEIMSNYFNSGEIVSNTKIIEGGLPSSNEMRKLINEAAAGMSDFLLSVYLEYDPDKKIVADSGDIYAALQKAEWQVVDVPSYKVVGSGSLLMEEESGSKKRNPYESARAAAGAISRESLKVQNGPKEGKK